MIEMLIILAMGLLTGILSGLLGVGGGVVLVPMMVFLLGTEQHLAQGISMLFIIPTALSGLYHLIKCKLVDLRVAMFVASGAVVGALISANYVQYIPAADLKRLFGAFVIISGIRMVMPKKK
ncbi:MAG TPA: sulfite exporter TauE/SafE family protein [Negativicutes bacterium]|nr:sulfite exporter TauE/SafE family protein [Negativicutes bacterium]